MHFGTPMCHEFSQRANQIHDRNLISPPKARVGKFYYQCTNVARSQVVDRAAGNLRLSTSISRSNHANPNSVARIDRPSVVPSGAPLMSLTKSRKCSTSTGDDIAYGELARVAFY
jgi:hypothetical protein